MRRLTMTAIAVASVLFAAGLSAQGAKPNFSGKWTLVPDPNAAAGGGGRGRGGMGGGAFTCGMECTITQDAASISLTRSANGADIKWTCKLDNSECTNQQPGRQGGAPTDVKSKATWDGSKITVTSTRDFNGNSITLKSSLSMSGDQMVVENTTDFGQGPMTTTQTYKKS